MNFENYSKIYKEILDDESGELNSNYLLNKYEIKYEEELLNILNQIKKNEYISSENKVINKLIKELDEDVDLLDINEIINIKEKVITETQLDSLEIESNNEKSVEISEIVKDKTNNCKKKIINNKNYFIYGMSIAVVLISIIFYFNNLEQKIVKKENIDVEVVKKENIDVEVAKKEYNTDIQQDSLVLKETIKDSNIDLKQDLLEDSSENSVVLNENKAENLTILKEEEIKVDSNKNFTDIKTVDLLVEETSNSEEVLNKIDQNETFENDIKLSSLNDIKKYIKEIKIVNGKLLFKTKYYEENSNLFGFKIFKITSLYVKFEDTTNNIRKRFLIKNN
ncbi:MAG: hypothetical protein GY932_02985 [Arcobacter sp.]|nr:hypothetical protein [Arcobacter sp.]